MYHLYHLYHMHVHTHSLAHHTCTCSYVSRTYTSMPPLGLMPLGVEHDPLTIMFSISVLLRS